jgi:hypothetical protein
MGEDSPHVALFEAILAEFKRGLTKKELQDFQFVTLEDVRKTALQIQRDQENLKTMMNMARLEAFFEAMNQFGEVLSIFANSNVFVAFVWGPLKFILQVRKIASFPLHSCYLYRTAQDAIFEPSENICVSLH